MVRFNVLSSVSLHVKWCEWCSISLVVHGDLSEEGSLYEYAPPSSSDSFSNVQYMPADQDTEGSACHLPEQYICATKIKTVMY